MGRPLTSALALVAAVALATGCTSGSTPITSASVADKPTAIGVSDGDLWPNCWSSDDWLYTANGDGSGFGSQMSDIVMNRVSGTPMGGDLAGEGLAVGDALGQVWTAQPGYTRKPTGMLCVDDMLYLAVQDLSPDFNAAPNATIAKSTDQGKTWEWDSAAPMFSENTFTTIWFVDYGKDAEHAPDPKYAYAYGLDGNWRDSFTDAAPDPTELFLARVPVASVQDRSTWEFSAGGPGAAEPTWTSTIADKKPVLTDERRVHEMSVLSQGGVTYLPQLNRYLYTSWTEFTFEFYEAPQPWGPWTHVLSEDFGQYPWAEDRFGGYGTTMPSKYLSEDNRSGWLQSNVCPCAPAGMSSYWFGLRAVELGTR